MSRRSLGRNRLTVWRIGNHHCGAERMRSEEHTSELQSPCNLVCRLLLEKKQQRLRCLELARVNPTRRKRAESDTAADNGNSPIFRIDNGLYSERASFPYFISALYLI